MKKQQVFGLIREILTAGGALIFGATEGTTAVIGLIVSIASLAWSIYYHEGPEILKSSIRKTLSALPGVLLALNLIDADKTGMLAALLAPLFALIWSLQTNKPQHK